MSCANPFTCFVDYDNNIIFSTQRYYDIKDIDRTLYKDFFPAPCRKCYLCKQDRISFWKNKLNAELFESKVGVFATLTFDDEHLQEFSKDCYQKFLKRLRKTGLKFKYFIVAELGEKTFRPHYHCIFFGLEYSQTLQDIFNKQWFYGFNKLDPLNGCHFGYLVNYLFKNHLFLNYSKKLGYSYFDKCKDELCFSLNGFRHNFSPYYAKTHLSEDEQLLRMGKILDFLDEREKKLYNKYGKSFKKVQKDNLFQKNINKKKFFELKGMI